MSPSRWQKTLAVAALPLLSFASFFLLWIFALLLLRLGAGFHSKPTPPSLYQTLWQWAALIAFGAVQFAGGALLRLLFGGGADPRQMVQTVSREMGISPNFGNLPVPNVWLKLRSLAGWGLLFCVANLVVCVCFFYLLRSFYFFS